MLLDEKNTCSFYEIILYLAVQQQLSYQCVRTKKESNFLTV